MPVLVGQTGNPTSLAVTYSNQSHEHGKEDLKVDGYATTTTMTRIDSTMPINTWRQRLRFTTPTPESLPRLFVIPLHVITLPHVFFTALQFASGVCWLVLYMSVVSIIFAQPPYNFTTFGIGCMTLGPFVGNIFGSVYGGPLSDWVIVRLARRNGGVFEPEMRLYPLVVPTIAMAGGIIMFGVTADKVSQFSNKMKKPSMLTPTDPGHALDLPFDWGRALCFWAWSKRGHHLYPHRGHIPRGELSFIHITRTWLTDNIIQLTAEAFIGVAFLRNAVSVAVPFALVPWMKTMGLTNMYILSGCIAFAIGLLFIPMVIWGKRIRTALAPRYWKLVERRSMI